MNETSLSYPHNITTADDNNTSYGSEKWIQTTLSAEESTDDWTTISSEVQTGEQHIITEDYAGALTLLMIMNQRTITEYVLIALIVILGLAGNAVVIIMLIKSPALRKQATNVLILNQSAIDFCAAFSIGVISIIEVLNINGLVNVPLSDSSFFSHMWCAWFQNHDIIRPFCFTSTLCLICIAVERYLGICHPFTHLKWGKNKIVKASLVFMYLLGPLILYLPHSATRVEGGQCVWKITKYIVNIEIVFVLIFHYFLPVIVLVTFYALIVRELASKLHANSNSGNHVSTEKITHLAKVTTVKMLITVTVFFIVCWTGVIADYILFKTNTFNSYLLYTVSELIMFVNCCCNPFIYIFRSKNYRDKIIEMFTSFSSTTTSVAAPPEQDSAIKH